MAIRTAELGKSPFDAAIYSASTVVDIILFSLCSIMALNFRQNQMRYVFLIMLVFFLLSLAGDSMNLLEAIGWQGLSSLADFLWVAMFLMTAIALIDYTLNLNSEITTVEEVNRTLHDTQSLMSDLIMQSPEAIGIFDAGGDVIMANSSFRQIIGEGSPGVPEKINLFQDAGSLLGTSAEIASVRKGGTVQSEVSTITGSSGKPDRFYQMKASPAHDHRGEITGYIVILVDITDRKRHEEELIQAKTQAELYLDLMSHDINNMNQVGIGFLEMALDRLPHDNEGQMLIRKPLEAMLNSSHLIDNVKKIRCASTGASSLEPVDIGKMLDDLIRDYKDMPGRDAMIEYVPVQGCYVLANPLLRDVFSNLINNAFKHSTGPLKIWVKVSSTDNGRARYYRIVVEDNGPGIPKDARRVLIEHAYSFKTRAGGGGAGPVPGQSAGGQLQRHDRRRGPGAGRRQARHPDHNYPARSRKHSGDRIHATARFEGEFPGPASLNKRFKRAV